MKKVKINKKVGIILSILAVVVITGVIISLIIINANKNTNNTNKNNNDEINEEVQEQILEETNIAETVYNNLMNGCEGAYLLNINAGETKETSEVDKSTCNNSYSSKLTGYNIDEGLTLYVGVLKNDGTNVYTQDGKLLGAYSIESIDDYYNSTTTYTYRYVKNGNDYTLVSITNLLME